jgi:hypothetical protein
MAPTRCRLSGLSVYWLADGAWLAEVGLVFIACQFILAYLTSGIAKLISPEWRSGQALEGIFGSVGYGVDWLARGMTWRPLALLGCWAVIVLEASGPLVGVTGEIQLLVFAAGALAFHIATAWVMGLNLFFWSFAAALACYTWLASEVHSPI